MNLIIYLKQSLNINIYANIIHVVTLLHKKGGAIFIFPFIWQGNKYHFKITVVTLQLTYMLLASILQITFLGWFCGVVVITSALHAEGREFEPRQNLYTFFLPFF